MMQKEKDLLIKDLCARLPYRVKVEVTNTQGYHHDNVVKKGEKTIDTLKGFDSSYNCFTVYHNNPLDWDWTCSEIDIEDIRPYLFPLSLITPKQIAELAHLTANIDRYFEQVLVEMEFYHKHHIDYRGWIEMGLAIDASELNIY